MGPSLGTGLVQYCLGLSVTGLGTELSLLFLLPGLDAFSQRSLCILALQNLRLRNKVKYPGI